MSARYVLTTSRRLCRGFHSYRALAQGVAGRAKPRDDVAVSAASSLAFKARENASIVQRWDEVSRGEDTIHYPRMQVDDTHHSAKAFHDKYGYIEPGNKEVGEGDIVTVHGRINSMRHSSSKLIFIDLQSNGKNVQVVNSLANSGLELEAFKQAHSNLKRGDVIAVTGVPGRTQRGELSVYASKSPKMLTPVLHIPPVELIGSRKRFESRHVDLMIDPLQQDILKARSFIFNWIRAFFLTREFTEVSTPILSDLSGGAIAKPFETVSKDLGSHRKLQLRIAPELWLKRLVIGGLERIFEIGPNFRNESADATHNPEFYSCEFYEAYTNIEGLKRTTEEMLSGLAHDFEIARQKQFPRIKSLTERDAKVLFGEGFKELDFIQGIEGAIGRSLPKLDAKDALEKLLKILDDDEIGRPEKCTLPGILDYLFSEFVEPELLQPTFVTNIPACLSPLSKTSRRPSDGQIVAHRAELFVNGKELANLYEEENSPFQQRKKFEEQNMHREVITEQGGQKLADEPLEDVGLVDPEMPVDEGYIGALEWGLPPTGGWGIGLDRLVMLLCNVDRIADVMSFGNLRGTGLAGKSAKGAGEESKEEDDAGSEGSLKILE